MNPESGQTRRNFIKGVGGAAGAAVIRSFPEEISATQVGESGVRFRAQSVFPELNNRGLGWLRFLWDQSTTRDDSIRWGIRHPWWDQYSFPGVTGQFFPGGGPTSSCC